MRRVISGFCAMITLFSMCNGYVVVEKNVKKEETLFFNFESKQDELFECIDISNYENVKILDYGMNKGKVEVSLKDGKLMLDLYNGKYSDGKETIEKTKTEKIENLAIESGKAYFETEEKVKKVISVDGDFKNAVIEDAGIVLEILENAKGESGYNKDQIVKSKISVEVGEENSKSNAYSEWYSLEERPKNADIVVKNVDIDAKTQIELEGNKLRLLFNNGTPKIQETTRKDSHSYFWIDRALDGTFREEYPNSIYRTDKYYFEGRGAYIDDERLTMEIKFEDEWEDYVGFILDNQKYVYLLNDKISKEYFTDAIIMKTNSMDFEKYWMNTEELTVEIADDVVRYIPKGILYSMGELVAYSEGWGETVPNKANESKESFYNNISERMETYVKHFKFFYGPKVKETFGGNFTYPYKAEVEYEHYKPATLYNGSITYKYEELEDVSGYLFDGWVKISYTENSKVNDYPPTAPYNVRYNYIDKELTWSAGKDDYTTKECLVYEVEVKLAEEFQKVAQTTGNTNLEYDGEKGLEFRVRVKDEQDQFSEWAYSDNNIEITGEISPSCVYPGETIDISAIVKSTNKIESVTAFSPELNINKKLNKDEENLNKSLEISFNLLNYVGKTPWLIVDDMVYAIVDENKKVTVETYWSDAETEGSILNVEVPEKIFFTDNGTIILANQNYTNTPIEIASFNEDIWYFYSMCDLRFINKKSEKEESLIQFVNDTEATLIGKKEKVEVTPYIKINKFDYINDVPTYEKIPIDFELAGKPIAITWNSKEGITNFTIYVDGKHFYKYEIETNKVKDIIKEISTYSLGKSMDRMLQNSIGYKYHTKSKYYCWGDMHKSGNILDMPFLGYKLTLKNYKDSFKEYNNLATIRDVNRIAFFNENISKNAINSYLDKIKTTNILINEKDENTVFVKDIQEIKSKYSTNNIKIPDNTSCGQYNIAIMAVDELGNEAFTVVPISVKEKIVSGEDIHIGRFFHVDNNMNKKIVEELSMTKHNLDTEGFISAGETLAIVFDDELDIDNIVIDIEGDSSIKEYDKLTETFLEKNPSKYGIVGDIKENYNFPVTLYPTNEGVFLYTIPYGTRQTLESWYTLRENVDDYEEIDKDLLFSRIVEPYKLTIYINGNKEEKISFEFDVFERWDTILNRDASKYIINSDFKWRLEL